MTISLIIPVHKGQNKEILFNCLQSILRTDPFPDEVLLVSDGLKVSLSDLDLDVARIIQLDTKKKKGPAYARNKGAEYANGELVVFIDSDIAVPPTLFQQIKDQFLAQPTLSALFGSYDNQPAELGFLSQYRNLLHHFVHQTSSRNASTFWTGCGAIKKSAFLQMGGFDVGKFPLPAIEDIELGYRLTKAGHKISLCKEIQVKHLKKWTALNMLKVDFFQRALPWSEIIIKEKELINDLNIKSKDRWSVTLVFLCGICLLSVFFNPYSIGLTVLFTSLFLLLNYKLYRFFFQERGWWFAARVVPWQFVFYGMNGFAFVLGVLKTLKKA